MKLSSHLSLFIIGFIGAAIFLSIKKLQLKPLNHEWLIISKESALDPSLSEGVLCKSYFFLDYKFTFDINSLADTLITFFSSRNTRFPLVIALNKSRSFFECHGGNPYSISYVKIPKDHQSTEKSWPCFLIISGANI